MNKRFFKKAYIIALGLFAYHTVGLVAKAEVALRPYPSYNGASGPIQFTVQSTGKVITLPAQPQTQPKVILPTGPGLSTPQKSQLRHALLLYKAHQLASCEKALVTLSQQAPSVGAMHALLGEFYIAQAKTNQSLYAKAQHAYEKAMAASPRSHFADTISLLVFTQAQNSHNWGQLEKHALKHPYSAYTQYLLGVGYQLANDPVRSLAAFEQAVKLQPDFVNAQYNLACLQETLGWLKPARDNYLATLKLEPTAQDALQGLKRVELQQKQVAAETAAKVAKTLDATAAVDQPDSRNVPQNLTVPKE